MKDQNLKIGDMRSRLFDHTIGDVNHHQTRQKKIKLIPFCWTKSQAFSKTIKDFLRILLKQNTALLSTVRACVRHRRDISHFSHIYRHKCHVNHQGTHQTLYILNQNHPCYLSRDTINCQGQ